MLRKYIWSSRLVFGEDGFRLYAARHFCTNSETKPSSLKQREDQQAKQFLANLSPEMEIKKKKIETRFQELKETGLFPNLELTAWDIRVILTDCPSDSSMLNYLRFRNLTIMSMMAARRLKEQKYENRPKLEEITPETLKVYEYTFPNHYQQVRQVRHRDAMSARGYTVPVVIDMDYSMNFREQRRAVEQLGYAVNENRCFPEPCSLHITSYRKNEILASHVDLGKYEKIFPNYEEEGFENLFPREKLVYLSPDAPQLRTHNPGDIYVIGGLVDLAKGELASLKKANNLNIRCGSIPFARHGLRPSQIRAHRGYTMASMDVLRIVLRLNLLQNWTYVMNDLKKNSDLVYKRLPLRF